MARAPERITRDKAREALLRSGYLLENRIETVLREGAYNVEANTVYPDPITGKSRELDVSALGATRVGPDEYDFLFPFILVECINNPQPAAFITKEPLVDFLHAMDIKISGLPVQIPFKDKSEESWQSLADFLSMENYHHYCKGRISTQFCSFLKKKGRDEEWMAFHDDVHFSSLNTLCAALDHAIEEHFSDWKPTPNDCVNLQIYYPVLVVQGELLDVRPTARSLRMSRVDHVHYVRSEIFRGKEHRYHIDVVTERFFPRFLKIVEQEVSKTARLMRRRHKAISEAIRRIAENTKRLRSPEKIRKQMDF